MAPGRARGRAVDLGRAGRREAVAGAPGQAPPAGAGRAGRPHRGRSIRADEPGEHRREENRRADEPGKHRREENRRADEPGKHRREENRRADEPGHRPNLALDTAIAAYLLDPAETRYGIGDLLERYTGDRLPEEGAPSGQLDFSEEAADAAQVAAREALAVSRLAPAVLAALDAQGMAALYTEIENPLVRVLARMEDVGIAVDRAELESLNTRLTAECVRLAAQLREVVGRDFNLNSPIQLRQILYEERGLSPTKRTKTGLSTDAATLEKLRDEWPEFIDPLLQYREVEKLRSTYGEGLLAEVAPDGRIHATFNQTVARTGRLSSDQPNLHNIPVRSDEGRQFRRAFIAAPGSTLLVADYNQIELRCIAHLAEDPGLVAAFTAGQDIHTATASRVFGVEPGDVTVRMRSTAKMISYGLAYGMEAYGLGQRLNIPTEEAALILNAVLRRLPERARLHGAHGQGGPHAGLHGDAVRAPPPHPRAVELQLPHPPGRRAPGHERGHPGPGGRHLQGRAGPARPRAGGRSLRQPHRPAGARRGAAGGARRPSTTRSAR